MDRNGARDLSWATLGPGQRCSQRRQDGDQKARQKGGTSREVRQEDDQVVGVALEDSPEAKSMAETGAERRVSPKAGQDVSSIGETTLDSRDIAGDQDRSLATSVQDQRPATIDLTIDLTRSNNCSPDPVNRWNRRVLQHRNC